MADITITPTNPPLQASDIQAAYAFLTSDQATALATTLTALDVTVVEAQNALVRAITLGGIIAKIGYTDNGLTQFFAIAGLQSQIDAYNASIVNLRAQQNTANQTTETQVQGITTQIGALNDRMSRLVSGDLTAA